MRKLTFYCDRCAKKIEGRVHKLGDYVLDENGIATEAGQEVLELCEECSNSVHEYAKLNLSTEVKQDINQELNQEELKKPEKTEADKVRGTNVPKQASIPKMPEPKKSESAAVEEKKSEVAAEYKPVALVNDPDTDKAIAAVEAKSENAPIEEKPKRKTIDHNKVMMLAAQGRSQVSIARELGITQPQVSMIINKYK